MNRIVSLLLLLLAASARGDDPVIYRLDYAPGDPFVTVSIRIPEDASESVDSLEIPRSAPGSYAVTDYAAFVGNVSGTTREGRVLQGERGEGSYFTFPINEGFLSHIQYQVDVARMEATLTSGADSSKVRRDYLGLLGYSVFGYADDLADRNLELEVRTDPEWPIFSTLSPSTQLAAGDTRFAAASFAELADAQYLLGPGVQVTQVEGAPIPLFVAVYAETKVNPDEIGRRALLSLKGLADYFGYIPMPHYTVALEYLVPPTPQHSYGFWMEHMNSMTGSNNVADAITEYQENPEIGGMVHHISHAWIPLRCYGEGYRPFAWPVAPVIDTIWLNEGFAWYISYNNVLGDKTILDFFKRTTENAPSFIKRLSLQDLSRLASSQYGSDFRIGMNTFSRGALLAHDLDQEIQRATHGNKSFRDAVLGLLRWTEEHQRAFAYREIEPIMSKATGVDLSSVWKTWQGSVPGQ